MLSRAAGGLQHLRRVAVSLVCRELECVLRVLLPGDVLLRAEGAAQAVRPRAEVLVHKGGFVLEFLAGEVLV